MTAPSPTAKHLTTLSWALGLFTCLLCLALPTMDGDAAVYGLVAKHMVQHGDWVNLVYQGRDWLDKPHFPFWMIALSFKLFGINERAYLLPGLLFYLLGAWSTHRLARHFCADDARVPALAALLYLSLLGLLLGAFDQKAEAYLLGLLPGASYALLKFEERGLHQWRYGLWGALLAACAVMTKGLLALVVLGAGLVALRLYRWKAPHKAPLWQWAALLAATGAMLLPELLCLYWQFDSHPEKLIFGRQGVSGLRFFFWDSQFGRFFNNGPIKNELGSHWFYVHNLVWTFFPWVLVLLAALASALRRTVKAGGDGKAQQADVFLWATFLTAFVLFSATSYQMDYYMFIVFPYASVACARWLTARQPQGYPWWWLWPQWAPCAAVLLLALGLSYPSLRRGEWVLGALMATLLAGVVYAWWRSQTLGRLLALGLGAVLALFSFSAKFHRDLYLDYNWGYRAVQYTRTLPPHPTYLYNLHYFKTFDFLNQPPTLLVFNPQDLGNDLKQSLQRDTSFYLLVYAEEADFLLLELARQTGLPLRWNPGTAPALQVQQVRDFDELRLPKQFLSQLMKDDNALSRRTLLLLRLTASGTPSTPPTTP